MAQSTANIASSYLHDKSPDMSSSLASYRIRESGGGRDLGDVHMPPSSRKYRVTSPTKAETEHKSTAVMGVERDQTSPPVYTGRTADYSSEDQHSMLCMAVSHAKG